MKLSKKEFDAMQMGWRKWYIEKAELKTFKKFGLVLRDADILEVGCGNGYAASLITAENPHSYTGLDVMPEQLEIARERGLQNAVFIEGSADDLSRFPAQSFDAILDFSILHHVEGWRTFFDEARRVLKDGGSIYAADLSKRCIHMVDALLHWDHAEEALFTLQEFESEANRRGFVTIRKTSDLGLEGYFRFRKTRESCGKDCQEMKYVGIYWSLFAPMMKKSIRSRFGAPLAAQAIREGKKEYKRLLSRADDLGPGNPMAMNAYFAYVFAAAWLGSGRRISPDDMANVMTDVLESRLLKTVFGMTDLNRQPKKWYRDMKKYEAWFLKHGKDYPVNWNVHFDEALHEDGSYYYFTRCPICEFCEREGISELMPALCSTDEVMFRLQHGKLYREHTIANGEPVCDYWVVGDRLREPR